MRPTPSLAPSLAPPANNSDAAPLNNTTRCCWVQTMTASLRSRRIASRRALRRSEWERADSMALLVSIRHRESSAASRFTASGRLPSPCPAGGSGL